MMKFELQKWVISGLLKNASLLSVPDYQREGEVWNSKKKKLFIDTIIKGWRTPKIYLNNPDGSKNYEIVDGQQRIYTILDFLENGFKIENQLGEQKIFKELDSLQNNILNYELDVEVIHNATYEEVSELFSRLQQGVALNSAEKLNAIPGKLSDFIDNLEKHRIFDKTDFRKKRYGLKSLCQQLCMLETEGISSAKYPALNEFFQNNKDFDNKEIKEHIIKTLDFMDKVFSSNNEYLSRAGNVISIYLICSWILKITGEDRYKDPEKLNRFFSNFFSEFDRKGTSDKDFISYNLALLQSTSGEQSIKTRNLIMKKHLYLYEPEFCYFLTKEELGDFHSSVDESLYDKVEQIHLIMREINERAIGLGRSTVFDVTSESSQAFLILPNRIKNAKGYKDFVDLLWKAFYEGSQSANKIGPMDDDRNHKKSMKELNILIKIDDLRKINAHDLEHDRETYEEKVKIACDLWKHYTGKKHINDFTENDFVIFQYKIIQELLDFLTDYRDGLKN